MGLMVRKAMGLVAVMAVAVALSACGGRDDGDQLGPVPTKAQSFQVAKATCGSGDRAETGLQGQIPMTERTAGFQGWNCNLQKVSAGHVSVGDPPYAQFGLVHDKSGHTCGFVGTLFGDTGTSVMDFTDVNNPVETALLKTPAMLNPGEGMKIHEGRGLLVGAYYSNSPAGAGQNLRGFDVYDVGTDCRHPQLLASTTSLTFDTTGYKFNANVEKAPWPAIDQIYGHEGGMTKDGLTYFIGDVVHGVYHAIDLTDPTHPKYLAGFQPPGFADGGYMQGVPHNVSFSEDGNRAYMVEYAYDFAAPGGMIPQSGTPWHSGFLIVDTSEIQARKPGAKMSLISVTESRDLIGTQMAIPVKIRGRNYVINEGEGGVAQSSVTGFNSACAAGLTPFAPAKLYYTDDEKNPQLINQLNLEVNNPKNCSLLVEAQSGSLPKYDFHMCTVDDRENATTLACGLWDSGIRVYDIRDPEAIKEIAYFNPAWKAGTKAAGFCMSLPFLDAKAGMLYSYCADSGAVALKFTNGVWPFAGVANTSLDQRY